MGAALAKRRQAACETSAMDLSDQTWLDALNPEQRAAATFGERDAEGRFTCGPLLVIAGAGTGKTATLAHRVAHLVVEGVDPARILLLTFSRRAAQEMTRRAERLAARARAQRAAAARGTAASEADGPRLRLPWAGTFHAIGARLLREHATQVGLAENFGILDRGDAADLMDVVRHERGLSAKDRRFPKKDTCLAIYSHRVNGGRPLDQAIRALQPWCLEWQDELAALYRDYVARKQADGVLDYDDLLLWWDAAMSDAALAAEVSARFDHVLVDEYQDTNALQARILRALRRDGRGLVVVGDDAQSIYSFRAADVGNILDFPAQFDPPARRVALETNYRSVQSVLDAAGALIAEGRRQYPKSLRAVREGGELPALVTVADDREQVDWVVAQVLARREAGVPMRKQAVLFRSSHHSDLLEVELTRRNIPYVKHGGLKFLESTHVKDVLSVLRWADNPRHGVAAFRALQLMPGMGPATAKRALEHVARERGALASLGAFVPPAAAREHWPGFAALTASLADPATPWTGQLEAVRDWYRPLLERRHDDASVRAADLDMLAAVAARTGSRERFLTELALDPPQASGDLAADPLKDEDWLVLSTVHSAKGQEWDAVYVIDVTDGNFPNEYHTGSEDGVDEERRLLYVAMTRARDTLHLIEPLRHAVVQQPKLGAAYVHAARSRFMTRSVLSRLRRIGPPPAAGTSATPRAPAVDVGARIRAMF
ncbi:MAG: ATP-dependent helicase [Burkholderiales bacterium]|nr:ATP-dependent helicase [Burkholderiales bacterium]